MTPGKLTWAKPQFPNAEYDEEVKYRVPDEGYYSVNGGPSRKLVDGHIFTLDDLGIPHPQGENMAIDKGLLGNFTNIKDKVSETAKAVDDAFREGTSKVIAPAAHAALDGVKSGASKIYTAAKNKITGDSALEEMERLEVKDEDVGTDL